MLQTYNIYSTGPAQTTLRADHPSDLCEPPLGKKLTKVKGPQVAVSELKALGALRDKYI